MYCVGDSEFLSQMMVCGGILTLLSMCWLPVKVLVQVFIFTPVAVRVQGWQVTASFYTVN